MLITPGLELPDAALQHHAAALGRTGSGKTFAVKGIVEKLLKIGRRVCILDPTGAWYGLKSSADGKRPGFPIVIFGGDHADVPITEHAGEALGELVGTQNVPSIIDLSGTTLGERHRFVERFAESLFRANKSPLHLIIDEADEFAPQNGPPGTERMLGAIDRIVRRGRIKGFRVFLISQRPAVLNKNVLTQAGVLIAMRLPAPQDRKAIEDWIKGQADADKGKEVLASLARLGKGEGWLWAPEHDILQKLVFPPITTFDSSRTPDDGEQLAGPTSLAEVDLSGIRSAMADAVQEAEDNDVDVLKKRNKELREKLDEALLQPVTAHPADIELQLVEAKAAGARAAAAHAQDIAGRLSTSIDSLLELHVAFDAHRSSLRALGELATTNGHANGRSGHGTGDVRLRGEQASGLPDGDGDDRQDQRGREDLAGNGDALGRRGQKDADAAGGGDRGDRAGEERPPARRAGPDRSGRNAPHQRILDALDWWRAIGVSEPTRHQVGFIAGYAVSGTFRGYLSELSTNGAIRYPDANRVALTPLGLKSAAPPARPPTMAELHERVRARLSGPQLKILDVILKRTGRLAPRAEIPANGRTEIAELAGYEVSGTFRGYLSELSSLGLIRYPRKTTVAASPLLYPEQLR